MSETLSDPTSLSERKITVNFNLALQIWIRNLLVFKKTYLISVFWIFLEPVFILGALGYGLGAYVSSIDGVPYVDFFFPALLCNSSMMVAFFASTYDHFSKLTHQRLYEVQAMTPIEPIEIVLGEVLWAATKGTLSAIAIMVIGSALGLVNSWTAVPVIGFVLLNSLVFASLGMVITTYVRNFDQIIYPTSGLIIPMSLFSGTYFPIPHLKFSLQNLAYLFPLTHSVEAARHLLVDKRFEFSMIYNFIFLILLVVILVRWAAIRLTNRLQR